MAAAGTMKAPNWTFRIGAVLACVGYGALALGSALDRMSKDDPALAKSVPARFASEALRVLGRGEMEAGNAAGAVQIGAAAVNAAPLEPTSTALYGAALWASGNRAGADRTFRIAGQLGWRVPYTQAYWQMRALAVSDYPTAALRTDALLRQQPELMARRELLDPLERNPAGQAALVARMQLRPDWLADYASKVADIPADSLVQRAEVLELAARQGIEVGCETIGPAVTRLVSINAVGLAERLWRGHCRLPRSGVLFDGTLTSLRLDQPPSPFAWSLLGHSDVSFGLADAPDGQGQRLYAESTASFPRRVLTQMIAAAPGRYRLSWAANRADDQPAAGLRVAITCHMDLNPWTPGTYDPRTRRWYADLQVDNECAGHWVNFGLMPDSGNIWIERTSLDQIGD